MNIKEYNKSVDLYADRLYRFAYKNMKDSERAQDVVQDVFEKVWKKIEDISAEKIKSYLFTATYHTMLDVLKKDNKINLYENERDYDRGFSSEYSGVNEILEIALNTLPSIQKNVILLRDYEGYSYEEIGEITNLKDSQVKVYIYRARKALQKYLVSIDTVLG